MSKDQLKEGKARVKDVSIRQLEVIYIRLLIISTNNFHFLFHPKTRFWF